ncbi:hypothetical protein [Mucilaginibacter sp. SP1R1]|uniref:hypothetical protein n=1 Tax=Mucilaginibacter sp. SP1R1 TaxID=2723091 RepID=UPI0016156BFA|nr:hypothetical protein [Mucilaginibacter sp. SP1R1]MBB6152385.1 hypothetical protein [Mucilaginibacter sp. SP1R1]
MKKKITITGALILCALAVLAQSNAKLNTSDNLMQLIAYFLPYLCLMLIVVLFFYVLLFEKRQNERHKRLKESIKDVESTANSLAQSQYSHSLNADSSRALNNLKNQIADMRMEMRMLNPTPKAQHIERSAVPVREPEPMPTAALAPVLSPQPQEAPPVEEMFYLSTPNSEGSFNVNSAQPNFRPGASIYLFKKTSPDKAIFKIDERETSIKLALQYSDKNIDPVCESANAYYMNAKKVRTPPGNEGVAELLDDKWIVTKKAKIYYE